MTSISIEGCLENMRAWLGIAVGVLFVVACGGNTIEQPTGTGTHEATPVEDAGGETLDQDAAPPNADVFTEDALSASCVFTADTCVSPTPTVQCYTQFAAPYDPVKQCAQPYRAVGCCTVDPSNDNCADRGDVMSCIKRSLADAGEELWQMAMLVSPLPQGFGQCDVATIEQVGAARACR
jgi:hypothetical protein